MSEIRAGIVAPKKHILRAICVNLTLTCLKRKLVFCRPFPYVLMKIELETPEKLSLERKIKMHEARESDHRPPRPRPADEYRSRTFSQRCRF